MVSYCISEKSIQGILLWPTPLRVGTLFLCVILKAWTSEPLWTATTTSMATLACVPDMSFLLVLVALNSLFVC